MDHIVYVVDDDNSVRQALISLLTAEDYRVADFSSAHAFLSPPFTSPPGCLILDMNMPTPAVLMSPRRSPGLGT